jgi:hypothetical protein
MMSEGESPQKLTVLVDVKVFRSRSTWIHDIYEENKTLFLISAVRVGA